MAKKEETGIEKVYAIPLRKEVLKVPRIKKANKAVSVIRNYIYRHLDAEEIKISQKLNEFVWKGGIKKPPNKIRVKVRFEEGTATAMLPDEKLEEAKEEKKENDKGVIEKAKELQGRRENQKKGVKKGKDKSNELKKSR